MKVANAKKFEYQNNPLIQNLVKYFLLILFMIVFLFFLVLVPNFASFSNIVSILKLTSFAALVGFSCMIVMRVGEISFSVGAQATLSAAVTGYILQAPDYNNYFVAAIAGVVVSTAVLMLMSFFIIEWNVPSFIGTLAISKVMEAMITFLTGNSLMYSRNWPDSFYMFKTVSIAGIPLMIIVATILLIILGIINAKTKLGRYFFAVGANATAAQQSGVNVKKIKYLAFLLSGVIAGIAGLLQASNLGQVPQTLGNEYLMTAICGATLSATFLKPGDYNVPGLVIGALILMTIKSGISNLGARTYVCDICTAIILILGVGIIALVRKEGLVKVNFT